MMKFINVNRLKPPFGNVGVISHCFRKAARSWKTFRPFIPPGPGFELSLPDR